MDTSITSQDVTGKDPLGRFLFRLKLKPWQAGLLSLFIFVVYMLVLPAFQGTLFPREDLDRSSIVDPVNMVGFFIIHPVAIFFYIWQPSAIAGLYHLVLPLLPGEVHNGVLRASRILHATSRVWVLGLLVGVGVVCLGVIYVMDYIGDRWYSYNLLMAVILQLSRFALFYFIIVVLARHLVMAFNLNRIYRHVRLPVMIGQSKYGVSFDAITRYGLWFTGFGGALGMFIAMRFFWGKPIFPEDMIYLILYLLLVPVSFALPFWQAHKNMRLARLDALNRISDFLQDEYDRLIVAANNSKKGVMQSEQIVTLRCMLELTEKAPTWPFENWAIYRVFGTIVFPFVMTGIGFLLDIIF